MKLCGIYQIINLKNNNRYIGSSKNINKRKFRHFLDLKNNMHHSLYLQRAYNKYGKENFKFNILEIINDINILYKREQYYIDIFKPEYNICQKTNSLIGIVRSEETKEKLRQINLGKKHSKETRKKMKKNNAKYWLGKKLTEEHKNKIKKNHAKGMLGKTHTKEVRKKLSESSKRNINRKHIHKENIKKFVYKDEIKLYLKNGWELGRGKLCV